MRNLSLIAVLSVFMLAACDKEYVTNVDATSACCDNVCTLECTNDTVFVVDTLRETVYDTTYIYDVTYVDTCYNAECNFHQCWIDCDGDRECFKQCKEECDNGHGDG